MKMPHRLCAVVYPQFVIQVGDVTFQGPSAITSLSAISWFESHREQLQDLALRGSGWTFDLAPLSEQVRSPIESAAPGLVEQFEQTRTRFKKWTAHPLRLRGFHGALQDLFRFCYLAKGSQTSTARPEPRCGPARNRHLPIMQHGCELRVCSLSSFSASKTLPRA